MERFFRVFFSTIVACAAACSPGSAAPAAVPAPTASAVPSATAETSPDPSATPKARRPDLSHWDFVDGDTLPIELRRDANEIDSADGYVVVGATVDGKAGSFLLDTGAGGIFLAARFAESIGLKPIGRSSYSGIAGNKIADTIAVVENLGFGKSVLHDVDVAISPNASVGRNLDGIIGYPLFAHAIVDVDLSGSRMRIFDPTRFEPTVTKSSYIFDIDIAHGQPVIAGSVGKVPIHPIFDSGNSLLLMLSHKLREENKIVTSFGTVLRFGGVDGTTDNVGCSHVNRVTFGAINYDGPIVCFAPGALYGEDGGIVGLDFLRHFNWTVDYPDKKFVLTPNGL